MAKFDRLTARMVVLPVDDVDTDQIIPARYLKVTDKNGPKGADAPDKPESDASDSSEDDQVIVAVPDRIFSYEGRERVFYRTRDGDSIEEIVANWKAFTARTGARFTPS